VVVECEEGSEEGDGEEDGEEGEAEEDDREGRVRRGGSKVCKKCKAMITQQYELNVPPLPASLRFRVFAQCLTVMMKGRIRGSRET
jgi:hypothetical protein